MRTKQSDRLLESDIHHLVTTTRFGKPANPTRMTLEEPSPDWLALFEKAGDSEEDWNCIMRVAQRLPSATYLAAKAACRGRDSKSKRIAAHRQECADFLDSFR
jgi:hypothetical protein